MPPERKRTICSGPSIVRSRFDHFEVRPAATTCHCRTCVASRAHACRCHVRGGLDRRPCQLLSPCVLPLVPPYLVFLAGTSLERFADREPEPRVKRETVSAAALFVLGFSTVFVALGASASVVGSLIRVYSGPLATVAGDRHHHHGSAFPRRHADRAAAPPEAVGCRQARRAMGRLCDRACVRVRMDAVHRADPRRHPGGSGVGADGGARVRACSRSIRSASAFLSLLPLLRSSRSRPFSRVSAIICIASSRRWARCWS